MSADQPFNREAVITELSQAWLAGLSDPDREAGVALIRIFVDDWAREASTSPVPGTVLQILRADLAKILATTEPGQRLVSLNRYWLSRQIDRLSATTLALGKAVINGEISDDQARDQGQELLNRAEELAEHLQQLPDSPELQTLRLRLNDAMLEALYAVERKAMSLRLACYQHNGGAPTLLS